MPHGIILISGLAPLLVEAPDLLVKRVDLLVQLRFPRPVLLLQHRVVGLGKLVRLSGLLEGDDLKLRPQRIVPGGTGLGRILKHRRLGGIFLPRPAVPEGDQAIQGRAKRFIVIGVPQVIEAAFILSI